MRKRNRAMKQVQKNRDTMQTAINNSRKIRPRLKELFMEPTEQHFAELRAGVLERDGWEALCNSLNIAEQLARIGIGSNLLDVIMAGQAAMAIVARRIKGEGRSTTHAGELAAIREAIEMFSIQLMLCTTKELGTACGKANALRVQRNVRIFEGLNHEQHHGTS